MSSTEQSQTIAPEAPAAEVPAPAVEQEESMDTTPAPAPVAKTDSEIKPLSSAPLPQLTANVPQRGPQKAETAKVFKPAQPASGQFIKPAVPKTIQTDRPSKQSIEQMEEAKLKAKFGGLQKPGGSQFLQKRLNKGIKYFDSGDYNVAKQSGKKRMLGGKQGAVQPQIPNSTGEAIPTPDSIHHRKPSSEISKLAV